MIGHGLDSSAVGFQARSCVRTVGPLMGLEPSANRTDIARRKIEKRS
jgi:hypothetical protein